MSKRKQTEIPVEKIEAQEKYIEQVHRINENLFNRKGIRKSYVLVTYGCQMNVENTIK